MFQRIILYSIAVQKKECDIYLCPYIPLTWEGNILFIKQNKKWIKCEFYSDVCLFVVL